MKRMIALLTVLVVFVSCASSTEKGKAQLTVTFHDYQKDAIRVFMRDKKGNDYEEMHDVVYMKVVSGENFAEKDYQIQISESPVRNQFTSTAQFKISIRTDAINNYENNKFIYSSEIEFIKS